MLHNICHSFAITSSTYTSHDSYRSISQQICLFEYAQNVSGAFLNLRARSCNAPRDSTGPSGKRAHEQAASLKNQKHGGEKSFPENNSFSDTRCVSGAIPNLPARSWNREEPILAPKKKPKFQTSENCGKKWKYRKV